MLTPAFDITQDDIFIFIEIKTPFVKISDVEFFINENEFKFYVRPYFLRLSLPGEIIEDGRESALYDVDKGLFTVKIPKLNSGEHFEDLEMLTKLLELPSKHRVHKPCIEVMDNESGVQEENEEENEDEDEDEIQWFWDQHLALETSACDDLNLLTSGYGFNNKTSGLFSNRQEELHEIADVGDPEKLSLKERKDLRLSAEHSKFDSDHYLADLFDDSQIKYLLNYQPPWCNNNQKESELNFNSGFFTEEEKYKLRNLPNKEYLLDDSEEIKLLLGLVDLIFAYAYNYRTTEGENNKYQIAGESKLLDNFLKCPCTLFAQFRQDCFTVAITYILGVESAWTINKLSSTLSWFEGFSAVNEVLLASCRRTLCYPLFRHWQLSKSVIKDTQDIFQRGRLQLLKCLLDIHSLFCESEPRYILNDLYITDYCVWIQKVSKKKLKWISNVLMKVDISKSDIGFELDELEEAARLVQTEEELDQEESDLSTVDQVQQQLSRCSLEDRSREMSDDDDDESSGSGTDEETSSEDEVSDDLGDQNAVKSIS